MANPRTRVAVRGSRPFLVVRPRSLAPLVLTCEHAGRGLPRPLRPLAGERAWLDSHWGWDPGAWALTRAVAERLGAGAVGGRWSRLLIDLNRRVDDPSLILREVEGVRLSWNRRLGAAGVERRIVDYHAPYHEAIDRLVAGRVVRGARPLLLAVHSFTPALDGRRRDYDAGVLFEGERGLARRLRRSLGDGGLDVRYNRPYSGMAGMMYSIDRHARHHGLPCLELEINQLLVRRKSEAARLARLVARSLADLLQAGWPARSPFRSLRRGKGATE